VRRYAYCFLEKLQPWRKFRFSDFENPSDFKRIHRWVFRRASDPPYSALTNKKFHLTDDIKLVYEKTITKYGTGAKIDAPKEFLGRRVYVLIREE